jgi:predicted outer membrane repeat protein
MSRSWIATLFGPPLRSSGLSGRRPTQRPRPRLEALEERQAPAVLTVNSTLDTASPTDSYLSLREAIAIVNSSTLPPDLSPQILRQISGPLHGSAGDLITFDPATVTGPITLTAGQLEVSLPADTAAVTIDGGATAVTVDGNNANRVVQVDTDAQVTLANLTLTHGHADDVGGALRNLGTLSMTNCTVSDSSTTYGVIYNDYGVLAVTDCTISSNVASSEGGGIYNNFGVVTVAGSTVSSNSAYDGGGIYTEEGTLTVTGSTFNANFASDSGGGFVNDDGIVTVTGSTLRSNTANQGGGISSSGTFAVSGSTIDANTGYLGGGGISNEYNGTLTVANSTISANVANYGGGARNLGTLTVTSSTFRSNTAQDEGGGIYSNEYASLTVIDSTLSANTADYGGGGISSDSFGTLTLSNSTLAANSASLGGGLFNNGIATVRSSTLSVNTADLGGGIDNSSRGTLSLQNTIVAGNSSPVGSGPDINGAVNPASGYNLVGIGDSTLSGIRGGSQGNQVGTPANPIDPLLAPLDDYGGPTQTMPPFPTSPALDAGDPAQAGTPDQRALTRTGGVNVGAYQASATLLVLTAPDYVTPGVPFSVQVDVLDPFGQPANGYTGTVYLYSTNDPQAVFPAPYTFTLNDGGEVVLSGVQLFTPGRQTLVVTDLTLSGTAEVAVPGTAVALTFTIPDQVQAGVPFDLEVAAYDQFGDVATGYAGTVVLTRSDGGPPVVYTFTAADAGSHMFSVLVTQPGRVSFSVSDRDNPSLAGDQLDLMF